MSIKKDALSILAYISEKGKVECSEIMRFFKISKNRTVSALRYLESKEYSWIKTKGLDLAKWEITPTVEGIDFNDEQNIENELESSNKHSTKKTRKPLQKKIYSSTEKIKEDIMDYLEKEIQSEDFDLKKLSLESVYSYLETVKKEDVDEAIDQLTTKKKLEELQNTDDYYIPFDLKKHKHIKQFKFGNPLKIFATKYLIGLIFLAIFANFSEGFKNYFVLSLNYENIANILANSVGIGFFIPLVLGHICFVIYEKVLPLFLKDSKVLLLAAGAVSGLLFYFSLSIVLQKFGVKTDLNAGYIMTSIILGITIIGVYSRISTKPFKKRNKLKGVKEIS